MTGNEQTTRSAMTIGELVVDWISITKGQGFIESSTFIKSLGGNASNVAIGLSRLGTKSKIVAKVGDDVQGRYLLKVLKDEKVNSDDVIVDNAFPTAQCYVFTTHDDDNTFLNWPSGNAAQKLRSDEITDSIFSGTDLLHATGISLTSEPRRSAVIEALRKGKQLGLALSFDAGFPTGEGVEAKDSVKTAMSLADIIKVNLLELIYWNKQIDLNQIAYAIPESITKLYDNPPSTGHESSLDSDLLEVPLELLKQLSENLFKKYKPKVLIVTLAERGSFLFTKNHQLEIPPFKVKTVAGVGAGDAYIAGFLHSLMDSCNTKTMTSFLESLSHEEILKAGVFASAVGALTTRSISAHESLPVLQEVRDLIAEQT